MSTWGVLGPLYGLSVCAIVALVYHLTPGLTRPDGYFGVTVSRGFRDQPDARDVRHRYRAWVWAHAGVAAAFIVFGALLHRPSLLPVGLLWEIVGSTIAFLGARARVLPHAEPAALEAGTVSPSEALTGGPLAQLGPFLILVLAAGYLVLIAHDFPTHRAATGLLGLLVIGGVLCSLIMLLSYGILHWTRRLPATGDVADRERGLRRTTLAILLASAYLVAVTFSGVALLPLLAGGSGMLPAVVVIVELMFAGVILVVMTRLGRRGAGQAPLAEGGAATPDDRTPAAKWRWGFVYFNRDDPATFVEKRFGIGYTLNFGHGRSWLILALLLLVPLMASLIATR